jgi:ABC-type cobalamin/Fe3+-siderophores transport system ATPase subunit
MPRLRVFAGPNGSGKSTLLEILPPEWVGIYVNADDLERSIKRDGDFDLASFSLGSELPDRFERLRSVFRNGGRIEGGEAARIADTMSLVIPQDAGTPSTGLRRRQSH